ncbi:hypothetical protein B0H63DRAFT_47069 [Podospora didyma]|uniref:FK506-binding protein n=1 Tax=Podospora didyma TaxID=330526 RepID=A0AAE0P724_9PEZI|nr:hypothetical protein B0H63DRAFT_47069 [Podospora didyma]
MSLLPVALYGLEVPPGDIMVPAAIEFPATIRITMAALDPTAPAEADENGEIPSVPRATLKIIKASNQHDDDDDEEEDDYLESLLNGDDDSDDEEANGGPSDQSKSKKAKTEAAIKKLMAATQEAESDDEMADAPKAKKGKAKATEDEEEDDEEESDDEDDLNLEDYVICTLDTERNYQQTLDITVTEGEQVFFSVTGTHTIYLTGNYVIPEGEEEDSDEDSDDDDYDLPPGIEDMADEASDDESDDLDDLEAVQRIKEIDTDEEDAPKLVKAKKGKNKRVAEDEAEGLDDMISKEDTKEEKKLSKKQQKKLKNNQGEPVAAEVKAAAKESPASKSDKKVQFAKNLEQGPTGPAKEQAEKKSSVKVIQGVTIDDRKVGTGRTVKSGDKVGMRYIGKLQNGKVFDCKSNSAPTQPFSTNESTLANKKGAPFTFKVGKGEVIKGWDIGIVGMSVGGERRLTIPASAAYGSRSMPGIPANSTLIFDVKLLEIK